MSDVSTGTGEIPSTAETALVKPLKFIIVILVYSHGQKFRGATGRVDAKAH